MTPLPALHHLIWFIRHSDTSKVNIFQHTTAHQTNHLAHNLHHFSASNSRYDTTINIFLSVSPICGLKVKILGNISFEYSQHEPESSSNKQQRQQLPFFFVSAHVRRCLPLCEYVHNNHRQSFPLLEPVFFRIFFFHFIVSYPFIFLNTTSTYKLRVCTLLQPRTTTYKHNTYKRPSRYNYYKKIRIGLYTTLYSNYKLRSCPPPPLPSHSLLFALSLARNIFDINV